MRLPTRRPMRAGSNLAAGQQYQRLSSAPVHRFRPWLRRLWPWITPSIRCPAPRRWPWRSAGQGKAQLPALHKLIEQWPDNTTLNAMMMPAIACGNCAQREPSRAGFRTGGKGSPPYPLFSVAPLLEAEAQLAMNHPAEALQAIQPALKYRYNEFSSAGQCPSYGVAMLLAARAQVMQGDKAGATKSYRQVYRSLEECRCRFQAARRRQARADSAQVITCS